MSRLIIHASNINNGGGKALLNAVINCAKQQRDWIFLLDARMPKYTEIQVRRVRPSVWDRMKVEWWLTRNVRESDTVLCFGNLPPFFMLHGRVVVFVQNKYLLEYPPLEGFSWKTKLRINIERLWFRWKVNNIDQFVVQTPTMKTSLEFTLDRHETFPEANMRKKNRMPIHVLPFVEVSQGYRRKQVIPQQKKTIDFDFLYVASGEPHKNHRRLIEAWCHLASEGHFFTLALTLDDAKFAELTEWIKMKKKQYGLRLVNLGALPHDQVLRLYRHVGALIFPSTFESFGLPLIEAVQAGLPVIAAELDYVRDVLDPEQTFDPESAVSITRAVKRFLDIDEHPLSLLDATEFINKILKMA